MKKLISPKTQRISDQDKPQLIIFTIGKIVYLLLK
ncbi:MAG: hypothetical protein ACI8R9_001681 [Paraglaciecola sp.]|jgi:hypothetical protein